MPRTSAKRRQKGPKERGPYTPKPVQERVIAGHLAGQSNRRIAREEGIDRKTVDRILTQQEVVQMRSQYKQRLFSFVPKALDVIEEALASEDERIRFTAATKVLEAQQVMPRGGNGHLSDEGDQAPSSKPEELRHNLSAARAIEMVLHKSENYDLPLPEPLIPVKAAVDAAIAALSKSESEENSPVSGKPSGPKLAIDQSENEAPSIRSKGLLSGQNPLDSLSK